MSFYDSQLVLDPGTAARTASGNVAGTNHIDLSVALRELGAGKQVFMNCSVTEAFVSSTEGATTAFECLALPYSPPDPLTFAGLTSTVSVTQGTPDSVNWTAHGLPAGTPVVFTSVGASGLTASRLYYVTLPTTNAFQLATNLWSALRGIADSGLITTNTGSITATVFPQVLGSSGALHVSPSSLCVGLLTIGTQFSVPLMAPLQHGAMSGLYTPPATPPNFMGLMPRPTFRYGCLRVVNSAAMTTGKVRAWLSHESVGARRYYPSGFTA